MTSHSLRSGIATSMAAADYSDQEIISMGRWYSHAFLRYIRTQREKRVIVAQELALRMAKMAVCHQGWDFCLILKLFDYVIILLWGHLLNTDGLQFDFKQAAVNLII